MQVCASHIHPMHRPIASIHKPHSTMHKPLFSMQTTCLYEQATLCRNEAISQQSLSIASIKKRILQKDSSILNWKTSPILLNYIEILPYFEEKLPTVIFTYEDATSVSLSLFSCHFHFLSRPLHGVFTIKITIMIDLNQLYKTTLL